MSSFVPQVVGAFLAVLGYGFDELQMLPVFCSVGQSGVTDGNRGGDGGGGGGRGGDGGGDGGDCGPMQHKRVIEVVLYWPEYSAAPHVAEFDHITKWSPVNQLMNESGVGPYLYLLYISGTRFSIQS